MQQRRLRLGDILDDYCPRERRITNHAVVAMIDDQVKQTRCTTCDADHGYKQAKVPPPRRKKDASSAPTPPGTPGHDQDQDLDLEDDQEETLEETPLAEDAPLDAGAVQDPSAEPGDEAATEDGDEAGPPEDDGPVHRRLIRATLPRPEGQTPERKIPEFTVRQPGGRGGRGGEFDGNRAGGGGGGGGGQRPGGRGPRRAGARGPQGSFSGPSRFGGGPRQNSPQGGQGQNGGGNRPPGPSGSQRGGGRPQGGQPRGPGGPGRKRGR